MFFYPDLIFALKSASGSTDLSMDYLFKTFPYSITDGWCLLGVLISLKLNLSFNLRSSSDPLELNSLYLESSSNFSAAASYSCLSLSFSAVESSLSDVLRESFFSDSCFYSSF